MSERDEKAAEAAAMRDYEELQGKILAVREIDGMRGSDSVTVVLDEPAFVRIVPYGTPDQTTSCVLRWMDDDALDPIYDLELLEPHPELSGVDGLWVHAQSYDGSGAPIETLHFDVAPDDVQVRFARTSATSPWLNP